MRSRTAFLPLSLFSSLVVAVVVACGSGNDGAPGAAGAAGTAGAAGAAGSAGAAGATGPAGAGLTGPDGGQLILTLSERAEQGLRISPVQLNLAGKTADDIELIGLGSYMANGFAECTDCHSPSPDPQHYFAGGVVFPIDATNHVVSRNLTPDATSGLKDTLDQFLSAERNGTDLLNQSSSLVAHPWQHHRWLSTRDLTAVYSFLQAIPPVNNTYSADVKPPIPSITFPGKYNEGEVERFLPAERDFQDAGLPDPDSILRGLAIVPLDIPFPTDPTELALFGRGSYMINAGAACSACHTNPDRDYTSPTQAVNTAAYMGGGRVIPVPANLAPLIGQVRAMSANLLGQTHGFFTRPTTDFSTFLLTITQGVHGEEAADANGNRRPLSPIMPYQQFRNLTAQDLEAVFTYFKYIATTRPTTGVNDKITQQAARYCTGDGMCKGGETCDMTTNECVGGPCTTAADCGACQTCAGTCAAPAPASTCLTLGL